MTIAPHKDSTMNTDILNALNHLIGQPIHNVFQAGTLGGSPALAIAIQRLQDNASSTELLAILNNTNSIQSLCLLWKDNQGFWMTNPDGSIQHIVNPSGNLSPDNANPSLATAYLHRFFRQDGVFYLSPLLENPGLSPR